MWLIDKLNALNAWLIEKGQAREIRWKEVSKITAIGTDALGPYEFWITFHLRSGEAVTVFPQTKGYHAIVASLPKRFPTIPKDWQKREYRGWDCHLVLFDPVSNPPNFLAKKPTKPERLKASVFTRICRLMFAGTLTAACLTVAIKVPEMRLFFGIIFPVFAFLIFRNSGWLILSGTFAAFALHCECVVVTICFRRPTPNEIAYDEVRHWLALVFLLAAIWTFIRAERELKMHQKARKARLLDSR